MEKCNACSYLSFYMFVKSSPSQATQGSQIVCCGKGWSSVNKIYCSLTCAILCQIHNNFQYFFVMLHELIVPNVRHFVVKYFLFYILLNI